MPRGFEEQIMDQAEKRFSQEGRENDINELKNEIVQLQLKLHETLKDLSSKNKIIEKLKNEFLKTAYEHNKVSHGHAWYPGDEDYTEYLERIDADARKKAQESLDVVIGKEGDKK